MTSNPQGNLDDSGEPTLLERGGPNAIAVANGLLADEWTLWILRHALRGTTRYSGWLSQGPIPGAALTTRLGALVRHGLLEKEKYTDRPVRYRYQLTDRGRQVWPILTSIWAWEKAWVDIGNVELPRMRHVTCGAMTTPAMTCGECHQPIQEGDVSGALGPSGAWNRNLPTTARRQRSRSDRRPAEMIDQTMELIGNRWSVAVLGAAFLGVTRFGEFQRLLNASPTIIADRLRAFAEIGVIEAVPTAERADWMEYRLTEKGLAFLPVVLLVIEWGQRWFRAPEGDAVILRHRPCASLLHVELTCSRCHEPLRGHTLESLATDLTTAHEGEAVHD